MSVPIVVEVHPLISFLMCDPLLTWKEGPLCFEIIVRMKKLGFFRFQFQNKEGPPFNKIFVFQFQFLSAGHWTKFVLVSPGCDRRYRRVRFQDFRVPPDPLFREPLQGEAAGKGGRILQGVLRGYDGHGGHRRVAVATRSVEQQLEPFIDHCSPAGTVPVHLRRSSLCFCSREKDL